MSPGRHFAIHEHLGIAILIDPAKKLNKDESVVFSLHGDSERASNIKLTWPYSLLNVNSFKAALCDGIQDASKAIINTVKPTKKKSPTFKLTGK